MAVGDFNNDGKPDLAVANYGNTNISVLLGKGDGTFQVAVDYTTGNGPSSLAVSDIDGDGKLDLVSANTGTFSVLLGNGDGTFKTALNYFGGGGSMAVSDFNGDGQLDLASANEEGVTVFLGNGAGTLQTVANYDSGMYPVSLAVADFNRDGKPDIAVAQAAYENLTDGSIAVLVGKDNATFETLKIYGAGTHPVSVAVGDFNGDGKLDLAAANAGSYPYYTNGSVSVLLGDGNGTFQTATNFKAGTYPSSVAVGDFNGDGKLDLAVANQGTVRDSTNIASASILVGNGDGTFQAAVNYGAGRYPSYLTVGDFNADGKPDLVVANGNGMVEAGSVFVLLGTGDGTFQLAAVNAASFSVGKNPGFIVEGDFNGDGKLDLAVANNGSSRGLPGEIGMPVFPPDYGSVSVLMSKGDGTFQSAVNYIVGKFPSSLAVGDFNGDGKPDLVVANGNSANVSILVGRGVSDLNGDGKLDIAVGVDYSHTISVLLNTCASAGIHLGVARSNSAVTLSWPLQNTGFALESITSLNSTNWQRAAEGVKTNNDRLELITPLDQPGRFFRLRKP